MGWVILMTIVALTLSGVPHTVAQTPSLPGCNWSDQTYDDFYIPPGADVLAAKQLGDVLRVEHVRSYTSQQLAKLADLPRSAYGAELYRVLYVSEIAPGVRSAVSGQIVEPTGIRPGGGFPLLAWAHGTSGLADSTAPSKQDVTERDLLRWVAQGYIVSASDYAGLGTPDTHPYMVGDVAGRNVLDAARAGQRFCDHKYRISPDLGSPIFLSGHSQGGQAALFAHQLLPGYAPELALLGGIVYAPASELALLVQELAKNWTPALTPSVLVMYSYSRYYGQPTQLNEWLKEPFASELPARVEQQGIAALALWLGSNPRKVFQPELLNAIRQGNWQDLEPWATYVTANTPGNYSSNVPVLVLQGEKDLIIPPKASQQLTQRLCAKGTPTELRLFPKWGHTPKPGIGDAISWAADRLASKPVGPTCRTTTAATMVQANTITRDLEPVILKGQGLPILLGSNVNDLSIYHYRGNVWSKIPAQIDELSADGRFVTNEDSLLDTNDEVVFMASDLGEQAPADATIPGIEAHAITYEITATDSLDPTSHGWAYLVRSPALKLAPTADYVGFDTSLHHIDSSVYHLGFATPKAWIDYLSLADSGVDILDRTKLQAQCSVPIVCPLTEDKQPNLQDDLIKDGTVRAILRNGRMLAYGTMLRSTTALTIPNGIAVSQVRFSTDFNSAVSGATFYNMAQPSGATVDGSPDSIPATPRSPWWQLNTSAGTVVQVADTSLLGGTQSNYYIDNAAIDPNDTGDKQHYGDAGVTISNPNSSFAYVFSLYFPASAEPSLGTIYADRAEHPILAAVKLINGPAQVHLPLLMR
jgi:pimeloyl-ACP methyl ester carboxylesterase